VCLDRSTGEVPDLNAHLCADREAKVTGDVGTEFADDAILRQLAADEDELVLANLARAPW